MQVQVSICNTSWVRTGKTHDKSRHKYILTHTLVCIHNFVIFVHIFVNLAIFKKIFNLTLSKIDFLMFTRLFKSNKFFQIFPLFSPAREAEKEKIYHCIHNFVSHCMYVHSSNLVLFFGKFYFKFWRNCGDTVKIFTLIPRDSW